MSKNNCVYAYIREEETIATDKYDRDGVMEYYFFVDSIETAEHMKHIIGDELDFKFYPAFSNNKLLTSDKFDALVLGYTSSEEVDLYGIFLDEATGFEVE